MKFNILACALAGTASAHRSDNSVLNLQHPHDINTQLRVPHIAVESVNKSFNSHSTPTDINQIVSSTGNRANHNDTMHDLKDLALSVISEAREGGADISNEKLMTSVRKLAQILYDNKHNASVQELFKTQQVSPPSFLEVSEVPFFNKINNFVDVVFDNFGGKAAPVDTKAKSDFPNFGQAASTETPYSARIDPLNELVVTVTDYAKDRVIEDDTNPPPTTEDKEPVEVVKKSSVSQKDKFPKVSGNSNGLKIEKGGKNTSRKVDDKWESQDGNDSHSSSGSPKKSSMFNRKSENPDDEPTDSNDYVTRGELDLILNKVKTSPADSRSNKVDFRSPSSSMFTRGDGGEPPGYVSEDTVKKELAKFELATKMDQLKEKEQEIEKKRAVSSNALFDAIKQNEERKRQAEEAQRIENESTDRLKQAEIKLEQLQTKYNQLEKSVYSTPPQPQVQQPQQPQPQQPQPQPQSTSWWDRTKRWITGQPATDPTPQPKVEAPSTQNPFPDNNPSQYPPFSGPNGYPGNPQNPYRYPPNPSNQFPPGYPYNFYQTDSFSYSSSNHPHIINNAPHPSMIDSGNYPHLSRESEKILSLAQQVENPRILSFSQSTSDDNNKDNVDNTPSENEVQTRTLVSKNESSPSLEAADLKSQTTKEEDIKQKENSNSDKKKNSLSDEIKVAKEVAIDDEKIKKNDTSPNDDNGKLVPLQSLKTVEDEAEVIKILAKNKEYDNKLSSTTTLNTAPLNEKDATSQISGNGVADAVVTSIPNSLKETESDNIPVDITTTKEEPVVQKSSPKLITGAPLKQGLKRHPSTSPTLPIINHKVSVDHQRMKKVESKTVTTVYKPNGLDSIPSIIGGSQPLTQDSDVKKQEEFDKDSSPVSSESNHVVDAEQKDDNTVAASQDDEEEDEQDDDEDKKIKEDKKKSTPQTKDEDNKPSPDKNEIMVKKVDNALILKLIIELAFMIQAESNKLDELKKMITLTDDILSSPSPSLSTVTGSTVNVADANNSGVLSSITIPKGNINSPKLKSHGNKEEEEGLTSEEEHHHDLKKDNVNQINVVISPSPREGFLQRRNPVLTTSPLTDRKVLENSFTGTLLDEPTGVHEDVVAENNGFTIFSVIKKPSSNAYVSRDHLDYLPVQNQDVSTARHHYFQPSIRSVPNKQYHQDEEDVSDRELSVPPPTVGIDSHRIIVVGSHSLRNDPSLNITLKKRKDPISGDIIGGGGNLVFKNGSNDEGEFEVLESDNEVIDDGSFRGHGRTSHLSNVNYSLNGSQKLKAGVDYEVLKNDDGDDVAIIARSDLKGRKQFDGFKQQSGTVFKTFNGESTDGSNVRVQGIVRGRYNGQVRVKAIDNLKHSAQYEEELPSNMDNRF